MKKTFILLALLVMAFVALSVIAEESIGPPGGRSVSGFVDSIISVDIVALNGIAASDFDSVAAPAINVYFLSAAVIQDASSILVGTGSMALAVEVSKPYYTLPMLAGLMCGALNIVPSINAEESYVSYNPRERMEPLARDQCSFIVE